MMPDFSGIFWMAIEIVTVIVAVTLFLIHEYILLPKISREFRSAKWSKGVVAIIQDLSGNVRLLTSKKALPEGVVKTKKGWFLLPMPGTAIEKLVGTQAYKTYKQRTPCPECGSIAKHKKGCSKPEKPSQTVPEVPTDQKELQKYVELYGLMVHVPTLAGLGKQIFFGSIASPMLSNLWTLAHVDLLKSIELLPMNMQKTQLDALETGARREGQLMMGSDAMRYIFYVILAVIPLVAIGLIVYLLLNGGGGA